MAKKNQATVEKRVRLTDEDWERRCQKKLHRKQSRNKPPQVLTAKLTEQFCSWLRDGKSPQRACDYLGINHVSFWKWTKRGEAYLEDDDPPEHDKPYGDFCRAMRRAHAEFVSRITDSLLEGKKYFRRDLSILRIWDRETWGKDSVVGTTDQYDPDERFL